MGRRLEELAKKDGQRRILLGSQCRGFQAYRLALQASVNRLMRPSLLMHAVIVSEGRSKSRWNIIANILLCPGSPSGTVIQALESVTLLPSLR